MAVTRLFGSAVKRREDPRMITGRGMYTDDVKRLFKDVSDFVQEVEPMLGEAKSKNGKRRKTR